MKYRDYKKFLPGNYYHVYNRGVNKENIFLDHSDFLNFQKRIRIILGLDESYNPDFEKRGKGLRIKPFPKNAFTIVCYSLISNHFHLLILQNGTIGIDKFILKLNTSYSMYFNKKYGHIGPLFQDSFKAKLVDSDQYLKYLSAYIHNNPTNPEQYPYSSFLDIIGERNDIICDKNIILGMFNNDPKEYKRFVLGFKEHTDEQDNINTFSFEDEKDEQ